MNDGCRIEGVRLEVVNGKPELRVWPDGELGSASTPSSWGILYPVCQVFGRESASERLRDRMEEIARETYVRAPGGITNRLRQALRNTNRYLYLRNRARGERGRLAAAMSCLAIRGADAYGCGVGGHAILVLSRGRVRTFVDSVRRSTPGVSDDWRGDGHVLGWHAALSDPRFSYGQVLPGDLVLIVAGDDARVLEYGGGQLAAISEDEEIVKAAQQVTRLITKSATMSALLLRVGPKSAASHQVESPGVVSGDKGFESVDEPVSASRTVWRAEPAREPGDRRSRKGLATRHRDLAFLGQTPRRRQAGPEFAADFRRRGPETARRTQSQASRLLKQTGDMSGLAGTLLISLLCGSWRRSVATLRSGWRFCRNAWSWAGRHRVLERLGRGFELAFLSVWAGSTGLLVRILPERQSVGRSYNASARPMARAKLVGFHPSRRSRAAIGALIIVCVLGAVAASAVRAKARMEQANVDALLSRTEEIMRQAEQQEDQAARMALLSEAQDGIEQAAAIRSESAELSELSEQLTKHWDAATGSVRLPFAADQKLAIDDGTTGRLVVHGDQLYVVDAAGQRIYRYVLDEDGKPVQNQQPWTWELPGQEDSAPTDEIVDVEWVDAAGGRATSALLVLTKNGSLVEISSAGVVRDVSLSSDGEWQNALAIQTYAGNLYVLDTGRQNILKYLATGDDYQQQPLKYLQAPVDIPWDGVIDMAVDGFVYLLCSDGSVLKFAGGAPDTFTQETVYPQFEQPVAMFASPDSASLFLAEPGQGRVVQFGTDGQFMRQFYAENDAGEPIGDLQSFTVDPHRERIYVGTATGLYSAPVPWQR